MREMLGEVFFENFDVRLNLFCVVLIGTLFLIELFALLLELGALFQVVLVKIISQFMRNIVERLEINYRADPKAKRGEDQEKTDK